MKFENIEVFNFEGAFRGLRNPMNSWDKSDSKYCGLDDDIDCNICPLNSHSSNTVNPCNTMMSNMGAYIIGEKDLNLAQRMIKGGNEQSKFLRQIMVSVDITAPRYFWSEFDTYKVGTVSNSCSTMHKLKDYPFTIDMFEIDEECSKETWQYIINYLEKMRLAYQMTKDIKFLRAMKQALPESFKQKRTITLNYAVIKNMYLQRRYHKLKEWSTDFVNWVKSLPYSQELICYED